MSVKYNVPVGASVALIEGSAEFIAVCAHPCRRPWLVTHDGREVEIDPQPVDSVPFLPDRSGGSLA